MLEAWREFVCGKRKKQGVQDFQHQLMDNILDLHRQLMTGNYKHGGYHAFKINDPKPRDIHKASVGARLVHHALHRRLYVFFDRRFIADSYSSRLGKGTHKALLRFKDFANKVSKNHTRTCWVLKCDIRKFFASVAHAILKNILARHISDMRVLQLIGGIIDSFSTPYLSCPIGEDKYRKVGLPLGNLTSQLLVNIYMNEFDQYVKHVLKVPYYLRYADDFVVLSPIRADLEKILPRMKHFLSERLHLELYPDKVFIRSLGSGVDFLGWVHFPNHRVLRTSTKRRMFRNSSGKLMQDPTLQSYLGLLKHGNCHKLQIRLLNSCTSRRDKIPSR